MTKKNDFLGGGVGGGGVCVSGFKLNNMFGLVLGMALKFYRNVVKGLKLTVRKFWRISPVTEEATAEN